MANKISIAARIDCFSDAPTTKYGEVMHTQVEERLAFYETGKPPGKNADAMSKALRSIEEAAADLMDVDAEDDDDEDADSEEEAIMPAAAGASDPSDEKKKKKKSSKEEKKDKKKKSKSGDKDTLDEVQRAAEKARKKEAKKAARKSDGGVPGDLSVAKDGETREGELKSKKNKDKYNKNKDKKKSRASAP